MPRTPSATSPTRKTPSPSSARRVYADDAIGYLPSKPKRAGKFVPATLDPLAALELEVLATNLQHSTKPLYAPVTPHGKPVGGTSVFGERRAPARRAAFRQPPR